MNLDILVIRNAFIGKHSQQLKKVRSITNSSKGIGNDVHQKK